MNLSGNQISSSATHESMADLVCTIMLLCQGKRKNGHSYWAYVCIKPSRAKAFADARANGTLNLEDYGSIIEWGEGEDPPKEVRDRMRQQFGMRDDFEEELLKAIDRYHG